MSITSIILNILGNGLTFQFSLNILLNTTLGNTEKIYFSKKEIALLLNMNE